MESADALPVCNVLRASVERHRDNLLRLDTLLEGLDASDANRKPAPSRWSVVECLEHLRLTGALYDAPMKASIARGRSKGWTGAAPYAKGTWIGRFILKALDPERPFKAVKAPGVFQPAKSDLDLETVVTGLRAENERLQHAALEADGLDLGRLRVRTPITSLLRVSLDQAFRILSLHESRHLDQADRTLREVRAAGEG